MLAISDLHHDEIGRRFVYDELWDVCRIGYSIQDQIESPEVVDWLVTMATADDKT